MKQSTFEWLASDGRALHVYQWGRHEMFNETNRKEVIADLIAWLDPVLA